MTALLIETVPGDFSGRRFAGTRRRAQVESLRYFSSRRSAGSREAVG